MSPLNPPAASRPTLLVFTLGPVVEARRRRLLPARHQGDEQALHRACLTATLDAGLQAGCRLVVSAPGELEIPAGAERWAQGAGAFGERLGAALARAAQTAAGPLVVMGSDTPGVSHVHVAQALAAVTANPRCAVVGPSPDGGIYLLALARPLPGLTSQVRWCRRDTLVSLCEALAAAGLEVVRLAPLADLDHQHDLSRWLASRVEAVRLSPALQALRAWLLGLLADWSRPRVPVHLGALATRGSRPFAPRGPPASTYR